MAFTLSFLFKPMVFLGFLTFIFIYINWGEVSNLISRSWNYSTIAALQVELKVNSSTLSSLVFYSSYHVKGYIRLPHINLNEPAEVWYNRKEDKSRIDYYNGLVKTYQDGKYGIGGRLVKVVPKYNSINKTHSISCWKKIGKKPRKIQAQSILPVKWWVPFKATLDSFKYVGDEMMKDKLCTKWELSKKIYEKNNVYTFWVTKTHVPIPVRYEMNGYDTLQRNYYDKYIIDYTLYEKWKLEKDVFEIPRFPDDSWCLNSPEPENDSDGGDFSMNPMAEFITSTHEDDPIESEFQMYKKRHGKLYDNQEHTERKHLFRHNARFINSVNRRNLNYKLKLNSLADMTDAEYKMLRGDLPDAHAELKGEKGSKRNFIDKNYKPRKHSPEIPEELDWRDYGAISEPRGQGTCGSCWAFAAVGAMEGANFIKTGKLVTLSEQQMMDCTWKVKGLKDSIGNCGCRGGWAWKTFHWGKTNTLATRQSYGPYLGQEGYCKTDNLTVGVELYGFRRVEQWSPAALRKAIAYHGPAAVSINTHPLSLKFYSSGILDDKTCSHDTYHAVVVIGYGKQNGTNYWLVKNSWTTTWGNGGYIKIKEDVCGVMKKAVVVYNKDNKPYPWRKQKPRKHWRKNHHKKRFWNLRQRRRRRRRRNKWNIFRYR